MQRPILPRRTPRLSRRTVLTLAAGAAGAGLLGPQALRAQAETESHGLSSFGDLKYPADFRHFDYVNPQAPKGGTFVHTAASWAFNQNPTTFNTMNTLVLRGDAPPGLDGIFASLMTGSGDEPDSMYGLVAERVRMSADGLTYRFTIRDVARFHDGTPITAEDVAWSFLTLKEKGHPLLRVVLRDLAGAEAESAKVVVIRFAPGRSRSLPLTVAGLPILSKAWYANRDFEASTMDVPLGSAAYKVGRFEAGRFIEYDRVRDWWGEKLPVGLGQNNFDTIRLEFFRDRDVAFEAFKSRTYTFREEFTSRAWATQYDFPAAKDGRVVRREIADETPSGAQGWFINTRREKFAHPKLREALGLAFDFEWTNKNVMFDSYRRTHSFFQNSPLMATGAPSAEELAVLEPFRGKVADEVFGEPYVPPVSNGSGQDRNLLRQATQLLREAGFTLRDNKLLDAAGRPMTVEFLDFDNSLERHTQPFVANLRRLGIEANIRRVDSAQYQARLKDYDFDLTIRRYSLSLTPGESLRTFFGSQSGRQPGSQNLAGIADPVIDALIDKILAANSRAELTVLCRCLDRVLRSGRYWVPNWYKPSSWLAYWDMFGFPETKPRYAKGVPSTWWFDPAKAARIERS
ncbi:extracellular solute-binding protein [Phreatobacter oligotrophus]|uniref:Microcin C transport system substrate-binding protein n=1 Tax=Phreatobacter oligotrophus TaxID=1122261 RepID=A0A2T4YXJ5_9HYPH|nr:extracellular solute-binding protein [Phreatobacter oligotrophus]PTM50890.1 microcin C transport system substrate-binding protein [Phreatobacter oligotrophus]